MLIIAFIIFITKMLYAKSQTDLNKFDLLNPIPFTLYNDNIIIFSYKGFHTFNSDFLLLYNFTFEEPIATYSNFIGFNYNFPSFIQFHRK